jgi:glutathione S-transferase
MSQMILHQFPYSHFNEKARWALAYKGVDHVRKGYLPGPHMKSIRALSGQTSTPVLEWDGQIVTGSASIIDFLEQHFPDKPLYPLNEEERQTALNLCARLDEELGPAARTVMFSAMLNEPGYMTGMFSTGKSAPVRLFYRTLFPVARGLIARANGVNPENIKKCREVLKQYLDELNRILDSSDYLTGDRFSVADLTSAALLAPLANPSHPDMARPSPVPVSVQQIIDEYRDEPVIGWVARMYSKHRPS